ncbi:MAG TPA: hypothetical protein VLJ42_00120 [Solirubrobacteraceae bacterium]|nr:hypothetical protein [Solirubrobacteraceae bacterium]
MSIPALDPSDPRNHTINVAGPAALLIAKLHKLAERREDTSRLIDKDAHDIYRLLVAIPTQTLAQRITDLRQNHISGATTEQAIVFLSRLFAAGPEALGPLMAGRAEILVGSPVTVSAATYMLARDLHVAIERDRPDSAAP